MIRILHNDKISIDCWNNFIVNNPFSSPFQTPEFYNLFNSVPGLSSEVIAVIENDIIKALVVITIQKEPGLKGFLSRRGVIYGGPILGDSSHYYMELLLDEINKSLSSCIYFEIRNYFDYTSYRINYQRNGYKYLPWLNIKISTNNIDEVLNHVSESRLRQIQKALRKGVTYEEPIKEGDIIDFYKILKKIYSSRISKPLLPLEFFMRFYYSNIGKYLLIKYKGQIIGGIMCAFLPGKVVYEFYICGLDREYKEQYPSVMATWAGIEYAYKNNIPVFDFMGAGRPDKDYGVREFKKRFGGEIVEYGRFIKINNSLLYKVGVTGLKMMKIFKH